MMLTILNIMTQFKLSWQLANPNPSIQQKKRPEVDVTFGLIICEEMNN